MGRHAATSAEPSPLAADAVATARHLTKIYGSGETKVVALDDVDVDFGRGRFTAIMGPSGSGKSTLMHCMAGLDSPTSGTIVVDGLEISGMTQRELTKVRRNRIGFVFQAYNLIPTLTARENITLPLDIARAEVDQSRFDQVVDAVRLRDRLHHRPPNSPAASSSAWRAPARWWATRRLCSPTNPPGTWTPGRQPRCSTSCATRWTSWASRWSW